MRTGRESASGCGERIASAYLIAASALGFVKSLVGKLDQVYSVLS
jgi:hypothetical protein